MSQHDEPSTWYPVGKSDKQENNSASTGPELLKLRQQVATLTAETMRLAKLLDAAMCETCDQTIRRGHAPDCPHSLDGLVSNLVAERDALREERDKLFTETVPAAELCRRELAEAREQVAAANRDYAKLAAKRVMENGELAEEVERLRSLIRAALRAVGQNRAGLALTALNDALDPVGNAAAPRGET